jgi:hypothetical protein
MKKLSDEKSIELRTAYYYIRDSKLTKKEAEKDYFYIDPTLTKEERKVAISSLSDSQKEKMLPPLPRITVCIVKTDENVFVRGLSVCSLSEMPEKKKGRLKALARVAQAIKHHGIGEEMLRDEAYDALEKTDGIPTMSKSVYAATPLNKIERKIFDSFNKEKDI